MTGSRGGGTARLAIRAAEEALEEFPDGARANQCERHPHRRLGVEWQERGLGHTLTHDHQLQPAEAGGIMLNDIRQLEVVPFVMKAGVAVKKIPGDDVAERLRSLS